MNFDAAGIRSDGQVRWNHAVAFTDRQNRDMRGFCRLFRLNLSPVGMAELEVVSTSQEGAPQK
jgi:hypothetical protein